MNTRLTHHVTRLDGRCHSRRRVDRHGYLVVRQFDRTGGGLGERHLPSAGGGPVLDLHSLT